MCPNRIHQRWEAVYHDQCVISTVQRWCGRARNDPGATDDAHQNRVNELIIANHRITQEHLSIQCGISMECVCRTGT